MTESVDQPEMRQVERRLAVVVKKERRDAFWYALLTLLCTPFFVVLAGLVAFVLICFIAQEADFRITARGLYTCINLFLAGLAGFVSVYSDPKDQEFKLDPIFLVGVAVHFVLLYLSYGTSLMEKDPHLFLAIYAGVAFVVTGLFGRVYMKVPVEMDFSDENPGKPFVLAVFGFIAMSYGEILSGSWLWFPPNADEISVAAWILCKLAEDDDGSIDMRSTDTRILRLLSRLKYIQIKDGQLQLTYRGYEFITATDREEYAVE